MAEETFRPERRPIQRIERMAEPERKNLPESEEAVSQPVKKEFTNLSPDSPPVAFSGNMPPIMRSMLQHSKETKTVDSMRGPQKRDKKFEENGMPVASSAGNRPVDALIAAIKQPGGKTDFDKITLPSLGKFYDGENGPMDGVLHIRPMTGAEEEILATPRYVKKGDAINKIFDRCIQEKYSSESFLTADRTYLLIFLRGISYSHKYDVEVKCPLCDKKFATEINLNALSLDYCPEDFGVQNLEDILPNTGYKFKYRLSSGRDEQIVQAYRDRRAKGFDTSGQPDDTLLYRTAIMVDEIEGITEKPDLQKLLKAMPTDDLAYLRNAINEPPFGVDTKVEITCGFCAGDFEMDLPLEASFFFPRPKKKVRERV